MSALIVLRMQNDYVTMCNYYDKKILNIICLINKYRYKYDLVIFVKDWYLPEHVLFKTSDKILCIQNTIGAEIHPGLIIESCDHVVHVNTSSLYTSNSGFYNIKSANILKKSNLQKLLDVNNISDVYVCGMDLEDHVFSTIMDANVLGYNCHLLYNLCYGFKDNKVSTCLSFMKSMDIDIIYGINGTNDDDTNDDINNRTNDDINNDTNCSINNDINYSVNDDTNYSINDDTNNVIYNNINDSININLIKNDDNSTAINGNYSMDNNSSKNTVNKQTSNDDFNNFDDDFNNFE